LTEAGHLPKTRAVPSAIHEYEVLIIERHLDTFGHVNNATYLDLFEAARWDWITGNGFGLDRIRELQQGPTVLEIVLRFKREIKNRQRITIRTWVESYEGKVGTVLQEMRDEQGELCCEGRFLCGLFDLQARRLLAPTPEWRTAVGLE
jgi:acyl-CoA thioester hydrolase